MKSIKKYIEAKLIFFTVLSFITAVSYMCGASKYPSSKNPGMRSIATGVKYNSREGLKIKSFYKLVTGDGVYLDGGSISLGNDFNGGNFLKGVPPVRAKNVTVPSMVVDRTPLTNISWIEMIDWLKKYAPKDFYKKLLPDENVWKREFSYNDPIVRQYFSHPTFWFHPVVGISWVQATFYCWWRTFRMNLNILSKMRQYDVWKDFKDYTLAEIADCDLSEIAGHEIAKFADLKLSDVTPKEELENQKEEEEEETESEGEEENEEEEEEEDLEEEEEEENAENKEAEEESEQKADLGEIKRQGMLLCNKFRLPTVAEYVYYIGGSINRKVRGGAVAPGAIQEQGDPYYEAEQTKDFYNGTKKDNSIKGLAAKEGIIVRDQKPNPWNGVRQRNLHGRLAANFKQGPGEYSDGGMTSYVYKYPPNNFGIFCYVGVSEFLQGIYREIAADSQDDLNPIRRTDQGDSAASYKGYNPLVTNKTRTYIGPNYQDTMSVGSWKRRPAKEGSKYSYIGFRCVQTVVKDTSNADH